MWYEIHLQYKYQFKSIFCFFFFLIKAKWSPFQVVDITWGDDWSRRLQSTLFSVFYQVVLFRNLCAMYTSHSPKYLAVADAGSKNKQYEQLEVLVVKLWMKHSMVHIPRLMCWVCFSAPREWQLDKVREKQTNQVKHTSKERKMRWQKRENIHKVVLKLFIEVILVQSISDVLENP